MQLIKDAIKGCREQWADGLISRHSAPCREYPSQSGTWAKQLLFTTPNSYYRRWLGWRGVPTKSQSYGQWCIAGILMTSVICPIGIFLRGAAERNPFRLCISLIASSLQIHSFMVVLRFHIDTIYHIWFKFGHKMAQHMGMEGCNCSETHTIKQLRLLSNVGTLVKY